MKSSKWLVALLAALGFVSLLPSMGWANGISVQVGYADDLRSNAFFPSNFCNGGTQFGGSSGATCSQVFLRRHPCRQQYRPNQERHGRSGYYRERDIRLMEYRGAFTVGAGTDEVLAQTFGQNFDTSDFGNAFAPGNSIQPTKKLTLSLGAGTSQSITFTDSGQVLNTGGFDLANAKPCPGANNPNVSGPCNESLPWRDVGTSGTNDPGGAETPEPASLLLLLTGTGGVLAFTRRRLFC